MIAGWWTRRWHNVIRRHPRKCKDLGPVLLVNCGCGKSWIESWAA